MASGSCPFRDFLLFMGAGFSGQGAEQSNGGGGPQRPGLGDLPENCVAAILTYLDPPEICRFAGLSRTFSAASSADFVWESKLPSNYEFLSQKVLDESPERLGKKEIYERLSRSNRFDGRTKMFWLEKGSGRICLAISWKALRITGIDDRRYWNQIPTDESGFRVVAYLHQVWWLEMDGELDFRFPAGSYSVFFRLHLGKASRRLGRRVCDLEKVHGWDIKPVQFQLRTSSGHRATSQRYLHEPGKWVHYHAGDFVVDDNATNTPLKIKFSMTQIDCTHTKGGLCVDSVFIYQSELGEKLKAAC